MSVVATHPGTAAEDAMWSALHERLRAFVARRVPDGFVVDDLAQEIMLRLYTHMGRLRDHERLDAWAYQVARNAIADYWRDNAAGRELLIDDRLSDRLASIPELESDDSALTHGRAARMHALMQTRIWNRNCEKRRFKALLESCLAFWLRRGLGSDIRACACNGIRSRSGLSQLVGA